MVPPRTFDDTHACSSLRGLWWMSVSSRRRMATLLVISSVHAGTGDGLQPIGERAWEVGRGKVVQDRTAADPTASVRGRCRPPPPSPPHLPPPTCSCCCIAAATPHASRMRKQEGSMARCKRQERPATARGGRSRWWPMTTPRLVSSHPASPSTTHGVDGRGDHAHADHPRDEVPAQGHSTCPAIPRPYAERQGMLARLASPTPRGRHPVL